MEKGDTTQQNLEVDKIEEEKTGQAEVEKNKKNAMGEKDAKESRLVEKQGDSAGRAGGEIFVDMQAEKVATTKAVSRGVEATKEEPTGKKAIETAKQDSEPYTEVGPTKEQQLAENVKEEEMQKEETPEPKEEVQREQETQADEKQGLKNEHETSVEKRTNHRVEVKVNPIDAKEVRSGTQEKKEDKDEKGQGSGKTRHKAHAGSKRDGGHARSHEVHAEARTEGMEGEEDPSGADGEAAPEDGNHTHRRCPATKKTSSKHASDMWEAGHDILAPLSEKDFTAATVAVVENRKLKEEKHVKCYRSYLFCHHAGWPVKGTGRLRASWKNCICLLGQKRRDRRVPYFRSCSVPT